MSEQTKKPQDYYIIDTRTSNTVTTDQKTGLKVNKGLDYKAHDLLKNEEYAELNDLQKTNKLRDFQADSGLPQRIRAKAANFHDVSMITPETIIAETDDEGLIWLKDEKLANNILTELKKKDKEIQLHPFGKQFGEKEENVKDGKLPPASKLK